MPFCSGEASHDRKKVVMNVVGGQNDRKKTANRTANHSWRFRAYSGGARRRKDQ
jgi:hypothetical protein